MLILSILALALIGMAYNFGADVVLIYMAATYSTGFLITLMLTRILGGRWPKNLYELSLIARYPELTYKFLTDWLIHKTV